MFAAVLDVRHILPVPRRAQRSKSLVHHQSGKPDDGVQRSAQFVAYGSKERRFGFALGLGPLRPLLKGDLLETLLHAGEGLERVQGLEQVVEGAAPERFDRMFDLGPRRDDDAKDSGECVLECRDEGEAVLASEIDVDDRDLGEERLGGARRTGDSVGDGGGISAALQNLLE